MVNVAIAGGNSPTLGRSMVSAILETRSRQPIILSRVSTVTPESKYGARVVTVDYGSVDSLEEAITSYKIQVVVSVLKITEPAQNLDYHRNILDACSASRVQRLIISDWSLASPAWTRVDALQNRVQMRELCEQASDVECSMIQVGGFLEYFAQECGDLDGPQAGLKDDLMGDYIEIAAGRLIIPCKDVNGEKMPVKVSMTSLWDIGRFVAASLDLPKGSLGTQVGIVSALFGFDNVRRKLEGMNVELTDVRYINHPGCVKIANEKGKEFNAKIQTGDFDVRLFKEKMVAQMYGCLCWGRSRERYYHRTNIECAVPGDEDHINL